MDYWIQLPTYLLAALVAHHTEARPIKTGESDLSKEKVNSLENHMLESSKFSESLNAKDQDSRDDSNKRTTTGAEKGAVIGGTVAAGIILGATVFFGMLIYKQYIVRRRQRGGQADTTALWLTKNSKTETTSDNWALASWRHTFNHRMSVPDSDSMYSQRSFGNDISAAQIGMASARPMPPTTMPPKAAQMLGVVPLGSTTPLPSPRLPNIPFSQSFMPQGPLPRIPLQQNPLPQNMPPESPLLGGPLPPMPESYDEECISPHNPRDRTPSNCTMSTLGRNLLHDVMQPVALTTTKFSPPPDKMEFTRPPLPISKVVKPPPVAFNHNSNKGQKRTPSRRYFVPLFKNNGQLLSPASPEEIVAPETALQEEAGGNTAKTDAEIVLRYSSRAGLFSLGENKI
ncbi:hypothetical protein FGRMN_3704 [Fusarium graminum]|nr:hypothetical protein FGRMN_3704 [Fusarium graminum]